MSALTCQQALDLLMDFLKRELSPEAAGAVQRHLDKCNPCERHARLEARFVVVIGQRLGREPCPDQLRERIRDALAEER